MKKAFKRAAIFLSGILCTAFFCSCVTPGESSAGEKDPFQKYAENGKQFVFYSYGAPGTDGYTVTEEKVRLYAEAGFNKYMFLGKNAQTSKQTWTASHRDITAQYAYQYGMNEIIIRDDTLTNYARGGATNKDDSWLYQQVTELLGYYLNEKRDNGDYVIAGVDIGDEPTMEHLSEYVRVYKTVKRVAKEQYGREDIEIYVCLLPAYGGLSLYTADGSTASESERYALYRQYIRSYLRETGAKEVAIDVYPFVGNRTKRFEYGYYASLQILAEECKAVGAEFALVAQSYSAPDSSNFRLLNEAEMKLQMNSLIGFGAKEIGFYRYTALTQSKLPEAQFVLSDELTTTAIYDMAKAEMETAQKFAGTVLSYDYNASAIYTTDAAYLNYVEGFDSDEFKKAEIEAGAGVTLVTELYDSDNNLYLYMLQNVLDTVYTADRVSQTTVTASFAGYSQAAVICEGETEFVALEDGRYTVTLATGEAAYIIPIK